MTFNKLALVMLAAAVMLLSSMGASADRVVFVHGFIGFGPTELLGVGYWGFPKIFGPVQDYINQMRNRGHQVLYASVGPLSSNWDRACELYAQIKGTRVDYGAAHAQKHGHARFGKDYTGKGFFPKWDAKNQVTFIGHSMGGNTIRMIEYLLQKGSAEEEAATGADTSPLFIRNKPGGNNFIHSIHTISAPHDGTPSMALGQSFISFSQETLLTFGAVAGVQSLDLEWLYDFDLDQFGLQRQNGESFKNYYNRIFSSAALKDGFVDNAMYDLGVEACWEFNNRTELTYPGTYYFSYSTSQTHVCSWEGDHCPDLDMEVFLAPTALIMGHISSNTCLKNGYCFSKNEWAENDGVVPSRSSRGPQLGVRNYVPVTSRPKKCTLFKCTFDDSNLSPGVWYNAHYRRDHTQIIGLRFNLLELNAAAGVYTDIANTLDRIKSPLASEYVEAFETDLPSQDVNPAAIAVPVSVGTVLIAALAVVTIRRRRNRKTQGTSQSNLDIVAKRASIVNFSSHTSAENPSFGEIVADEVSVKV